MSAEHDYGGVVFSRANIKQMATDCGCVDCLVLLEYERLLSEAEAKLYPKPVAPGVTEVGHGTMYVELAKCRPATPTTEEP